MGFVGRWYKISALLAASYLVMRLFWHPDALAGPIFPLKKPAVFLFGVGLSLFGVFLALTAQIQMAASWRIGIPDGDRPGALVKAGLYRLSRNPFFLGAQFYSIGIFLMVPVWFMLMTVVIQWVCVNIQVRLEEDYLSSHLGSDYTAYKSSVRRWI